MSALRRLGTVFCAAAFALAGWGAETSGDVSGYLFYGGEVSAKKGKAYYPVLRVDKKGIYVEGDFGVKKVNRRAPVALSLKPVFSERYVEFLDLDFDVISSRVAREEAAALSDIGFVGTQSDIQAGQVKAGIIAMEAAGVKGRDLEREYQKLEAIEADSVDMQRQIHRGIEDGDFEHQRFGDTVYLKGEYHAHADVKDAYFVVGIRSTMVHAETGRPFEFSDARMGYLGDLMEGEVSRLKFRAVFPEFDMNSVKWELYLFSGDGEPIASNRAKGVRALGAKESAAIKDRMALAK
ncbi:hypothetical protein [Pelagicoccus mobilis]|uniref:Uncharacterized protein n=1 Tax=Pelagicoccus mobilis TaxID=415221 RepID=A0A934RZ85_9BACT|nr:hypothetical protein [Pelagicoccus mobilis]MBK1878250.1 hypothetical protein [Pelagicoccus mobilis]